ncbi:hypothetical protein HDK90DRAFT_509128 [Phyllosticta capitalensis]|uniref:BTB domain-containing protein n=1 Tax=Phyllosticta capitalensis TaxID=121624 RepID=A0ABR1YY25_9PEZI
MSRNKCWCGNDTHHRSELQHRMAFIKAKSLDNGLMITVVVGGEDSPRTFNIHETLLRSTSPFCDKALSGDWKESKDKKINLPDEDPMIFDVYQKWLMLDKILIGSQGQSPLEAIKDSEVIWDSPTDSDSDSDSESDSKSEPEKDSEPEPESESEPESSSSVIFKILLGCYVLGDHLLDTNFKNTIIDTVTSLIEAEQYPTEWISVLPQKLPESSGLRRLFEDVWVDLAEGDWIEQNVSNNMDETVDFLVHLTKKVLDARSVSSEHRWVPEGCRCKYYDKALEEERDPPRAPPHW